MAKLIVYHDGSCPLCQREIAHYKRQVGSDGLDFVDVSRDDAEVGPDLDARQAMRRFHVRLPDGTLLSGAAGFAAVWRRLPRWRRAAAFTCLPGIMPTLELGYRASLTIRPLIARVVRRFGQP